jgi:hypothetical protein
MSGSMTQSPPVVGARPGLCARLGLIIAIGLIWTHNSTHGMAGTSGSGDGPVDCPICGLPGGDRGDGTYVCANNHVFTAEEAEAVQAETVQAEEAEAEAANREG